MKTFEELQKMVIAKGYMSLSFEDRERYSKLKRANKAESAPKKADAPEEQKTITLTQDELQEAINKGIENYRSRPSEMKQPDYNEWAEVDPTKRPNRTATLRLYQKDTQSPFGLIIRADYLRTDWNEETHKHDKLIYEIEVLYEDGKKEVLEIDSANYVKLNRRERVELVENDRKKLRKVIGKVRVPTRDKDGYPIKTANDGYGAMQGDLGQVDQEVIKYEEVFTAKRDNGQKFKIHAKYLNN